MTTAPRLTIDLAALRSNWKLLESRSHSKETAAVVKADGYGLGIVPVSKALYEEGVRTFFVAMAEEGESIRDALPDATIFVLNGLVRETVPVLIENHLYPVLSTPGQIENWSEVNQGVPCAIHMDTGMNRLGLTLEEAARLGEDASMVSGSAASLLMSHLACADEPKDPKNEDQRSRFEAIAKRFPGLRKSFANSAGILLDERYHFDLARPGIALYGAEAVNNVPNPMQPVVKAEARILQIRNAKKGETVGYGGAYALNDDARLATVSAGYADGYLRSSSSSGIPLRRDGSTGAFGAIGKHRVPVIGRVSMDLTIFDVSNIPENELEQVEWIELFGDEIPVDDVARAAGTIGYELLTNLGRRYQRHYTDNSGND